VIDPRAAIGEVHLTIADLDRSLRFYQTRLGFTLHQRGDETARLGAGGADLLVLSQRETARRVRGTTGLYHFAVLVPSRADLARALRRLVDTKTPMQGAADHGVSEALYLADPDGNGIEVYRDRPRAEWPYVGSALAMGADPFDMGALLAESSGLPRQSSPLDLGATAASDDAGLAPGTTVGHVHLHVSRLPEAEHFYVDVLGFALMQRYGPSALFVSAGGYHHHIGLNTWAGVGAPPPPPGAIGLRHFTVRLPDAQAMASVVARLGAAGLPVESGKDGALTKDPAGNIILFQADSSRID
jgi:catechol 2,3-dioxygenase